MGTKRKDEELADRLLDFAVRIIKLVKGSMINDK